ncbi:hypothetical protein GGE09_001078 [Roseobacter sp. N2S]|nr:hypothetical protein [Roseobacter sp. N2S]
MADFVCIANLGADCSLGLQSAQHVGLSCPLWAVRSDFAKSPSCALLAFEQDAAKTRNPP